MVGGEVECESQLGNRIFLSFINHMDKLGKANRLIEIKKEKRKIIQEPPFSQHNN